MRTSLGLLLAAATAISATATFVPAQAAPANPPLPAAGVIGNEIGTVQQVDWQGRDHRRGDNWGRDDNRRHHRHHRRHDSGFGVPFYFGFPFAPQAYYHRPYQPYYGYGDCFRTWDGQLICR